MQSLSLGAFWLSRLVNITVLAAVAYGSGLLVTRHDVRVNYTRKMNHFTLFFLPILLEDVFPYESTIATTVMSGVFYFLFLAWMTKPFRTRSAVSSTMFASFDRPEDRPHTMLWLSTQVAAGFAVLVPFGWYLLMEGSFELAYIPVLINGIGDGLAEPVGVRFGRRSYEVRAIFTQKRYTRTVAGSACVFLTGVIVVAAFRDAFTAAQFVAALLSIPLSLTLAEAVAPHTWDTPVMFLVGGLVLVAIITII